MLNRGKMARTCVPPPEGLLGGFPVGRRPVRPRASREQTILQESIVTEHGVFVTIDFAPIVMLNRGKMARTCVPPPEVLLSGFPVEQRTVRPLASRERTILQESIVTECSVYVTIDLRQL